MPRSELPTNLRPSDTQESTVSESAGSPSSKKSTLPGAGETALASPLPAVPGYRVLGRLGEGGMGTVYEVIDEKVGVRLALKMIRPDRVDANFLARFRQEIRAMMLLDHPNIARIFGHGECDGCPYFTMKYFPGGELASRKEEFHADTRKAVELTAKVAAAVQYLHDQGKIHRDLKLSNILLDESGEPALSDFGLVKEFGDSPQPEGGQPPRTAGEGDASTATPEAETRPGSATPLDDGALTRMGDVMGTRAYMSPEQTRGAREIGLQSDVWALGVILYELLAGRKPFLAQDARELMRRINEESPRPPSSFRERQEPELDAVVLKCLSKDAGGRYESVAAFADALRGWLKKGAPRKKRPWVNWALAAGAALCLALLGVAMIDRPRPPAQTADQWLEEAQTKLANGERVHWVRETGLPRWFRVRAGAVEGVGPRTAWDDTCTIQTDAIALVEICPDPKRDSFRFEAEVRQNSGGRNNSRVGVYVMHQASEADPNVFPFAYWAFTEDVPRAAWTREPPEGTRVVRAAFNTNRVWMTPPARFGAGGANVPRAVELTEPAEKDYDWRPLIVDVAPDGITLSFDGQSLTYPREGLNGLNFFAKQLGVPAFDPRGGLGFYLSAASASFRRVSLGPLPAK
jgi:serine/threonine protein kinase